MALNPILVDQARNGDETTLNRLLCLFEDKALEQVRFAVAYVRWEGLGLLSKSIEAFISRGGRFESIYGAGNGVTTPDALYYGMLLDNLFPGRTYAGFVEDDYANATFHPKYYEFRFASETRVIVGSSNLTGGGLQRNSEASLEVKISRGGADEKALDAYWVALRKSAKMVTLGHVQRISKSHGTASEDREKTKVPSCGKPYLPTKTKPHPRPLFQKIMGLSKPSQATKDKLLSEFSEISDRPKHLYLQILARETGGQSGKSGSAVQLPVATLGAYFGVARSEERSIRLVFPNGPLETNITHFSNNTHQVRIQPILEIDRPAVLHLTREGGDTYKARFIPPDKYETVLKAKCTNQSRKNSRRWGFV
ncbi:phospholipase D family protein [Neotabrizicola sp. VNH66]